LRDKKMKTRQLGVLFVAGGSAVMLLPYYLHHSGGFDFGDWGGGHKGELHERVRERQALADLAAEIAAEEEKAIQRLTQAAKGKGVSGAQVKQAVKQVEDQVRSDAKQTVLVKPHHKPLAAKIEAKIEQKARALGGLGGGPGARGGVHRKASPGAAKLPHEAPLLVPESERRGVRGKLVCGREDRSDSEVIYWREVPGDSAYESPVTPHHHEHGETYLTFAYDQGGWNNIRMSIEIMLVTAHAMGRTLVAPPVQNLYLLGKPEVDPKTGKRKQRPLGFEDFFDLERLKGQKGFHAMSMRDFLGKEAADKLSSGQERTLKGPALPGNNTDLWGRQLWDFIAKAADIKPAWGGTVLALPASLEHLNGEGDGGKGTGFDDPAVERRLKKFAGPRRLVYYDTKLQEAKLLYFPAGGSHRLLQHHYAFNFFADPRQQSFYKRFIRDYLRYQDAIQCAGDELVRLVREDVKQIAKARQETFVRRGEGFDSNNDSTASSRRGPGAATGELPYYALHVRRGDFQFKDVKISASEIVENIGDLIPRGSVVYISTDDPKGICEGCVYKRKPCPTGAAASATPGCIEDPSWQGFTDAGWEVRFLGDYLKRGALKGVNANFHGMVESIVCSRAELFVGTWWSTFTGYIHRLRGYHGLGEATYYHTTGRRNNARAKESVGHGFSREFRSGWTDDAGSLI